MMNLQPEPAEPVLSARELEVVQHAADGHNYQQTAQRMELSHHTVHWHMASVLKKLGVKNKTRAVVIALRKGLIQ